MTIGTIKVRITSPIPGRKPYVLDVPLYQFGSPELDEFHKRNKGWGNDNRYACHDYPRYAVYHSNVNGGWSGYTLGRLWYGQVVPEIKDLKRGADGVFDIVEHS